MNLNCGFGIRIVYNGETVPRGRVTKLVPGPLSIPGAHWSMQEADDALMIRLAGGSHEAFGTLVRRYEAQARRFCYRMFRDTQVAEDVAQEAFLKLYLNADRYQPSGKFVTWFYRVLGNLCYDRLRFEKRRNPVTGTTMDGVSLDGYTDGEGGADANGRFVGPVPALLRKE